MHFNPNTPFNDLPDLPPPIELETKAVLKASIAAREALAALRLAAQRLPNPEILVGSLSLLEAKASSEIENIMTTNDALFRHAALEDAAADPATKEALRYRQALFEGVRNLKDRPLSTRTAVDICRKIKGIEIDIRRTPGITLRNDRTGAVIYTPPEGEALIREKLANWERFLHEETGIDPLVRLAVQHYQLEAIHPFADGNGRTGRILNILFLIEQGLLDHPILTLSREILGTREDYYRLLLGVTRQGGWIEWISYFLEVVQESALASSQKAQRIEILMLDTEIFFRKLAPKIYSPELMGTLFSRPYCRIADLERAAIAKRQTASAYLQSLTNWGVLRDLKVGREKLFVHGKLLELLTTDGSRVTKYLPNALARPELMFPAGEETQPSASVQE